MNDQSGLSFPVLSLSHFSELRQSKSGSAEMKRAGRELMKIMEQLGFKKRRDFAAAMHVTPACVSRWFQGARKMQKPSLERLAALVQQRTAHEEVLPQNYAEPVSDEPEVFLEVRLEGYVSSTQLLEVAQIADLLERSGSAFTLRQAIECLFHKALGP